MDQTSPTVSLPPFEQVEKNIALSIIFSIITFGFYNLFWQSDQMKTWNYILGYDKYNFWKWLLLCIVTFGFYHIYYEYQMGEDMVAFQKKLNRPVTDVLPIVCVLLAIFALPMIADAVQQYELHKLYNRERE